MDDAISRKGVSAWLYNMGHPNLAKIVMDKTTMRIYSIIVLIVGQGCKSDKA